MAKKIKLTEEEQEALNREQEEQEQFYSGESLNPALQSMYAALGIEGDADTTVHVSKVDYDGKGNDANIWKGDPEAYELESLARKFGSGTYRVMVYVKMPSGKKVRQINKTITWLLTPEDEAKRTQVLTQPQAVPVAAPQPDVMAMMREMMLSFQSTIKDTLLAMQPKEKDPLTTLQGIKELASVLIPAAPAHQPDSFNTIMKGVESFLSIQERLKPASITDSEGEISVPNAILAGIRELKNLRQPAQPATPETATAALPNPAATPAVNANGLTAEQQAEIDEMNIVLHYQLKQANKAAASKADPADYAESVYSVIPEDILQMIATDKEWFAKLIEIAPACAPFKSWYETVAEKLKSLMIEDGLLTLPAEKTDNSANGTDNAGTGLSA